MSIVLGEIQQRSEMRPRRLRRRAQPIANRRFSVGNMQTAQAPAARNRRFFSAINQANQEELYDEDFDNAIYCICRRRAYGQMIFCDGPNCAIKWFHFQCVGINSAPTGNWYCFRCRFREGNHN